MSITTVLFDLDGTLLPMDQDVFVKDYFTRIAGKVILAHCLNENAANTLKKMIETDLPNVVVKIGKNLGLCSYYAEKGGLLVGYEKC